MNNLEIFSIGVSGALFVAIALAVTLFMRRLRKLQAQLTASGDIAQQASSRLETRLQESDMQIALLQSQVRELEEQARLVSGAPVKSWTNINKRTQAVRLLRSGAPAERIAAELTITRGEVDLIRKIQRLTSELGEPVHEFSRFKENSISPMRS